MGTPDALTFFYIYSHPNRPLVSLCNERTNPVMRIYVGPPRGSGREQVVLHQEGDYQVLKGLSLIALGGFFIV